MAKKHYCQKCQKLIEEGKQIKFGKLSNYQQEEEIQAKNEKTWKQVG